MSFDFNLDYSVKGDITQRSSFINKDINTKKAEDVNGSIFTSNPVTLAGDEQASILSQYLSDFDGFNKQDAADHSYFKKENEDGTNEFLRVVDDGGTIKVIHTTSGNGAEAKTEVYEITKADKFNNWTNDENNYEAALNDEPVDDFKMFDINLSTYSKDLKEFAQEIVGKFDTDRDGSWDIDEFTNMALGNEDIPVGMEKQYSQLFAQLFKALNLDTKENKISASELATMLYASDLDWNNYSQTGDIASSIDGKLGYNEYSVFSGLLEGDSGYNVLRNEREDFFNAFYEE